MERRTSEKHLQIIESYYENSRCMKNVFHQLQSYYGRHNRSTVLAIKAILTKFHNCFQHQTRMSIVQTVENITRTALADNALWFVIENFWKLSCNSKSTDLDATYLFTFVVRTTRLSGVGLP